MSRVLDFIFSIVVIIGLSPLLLILVVFYLVQGKFNFIFKQQRIGYRQVPFIFYKFRTLVSDESKSLQQREFPFGRFLRKSSLDELPQLWNILKGDMSFVGPRPLPVEYLPYFSEEQMKRFQVKPGLTGWAQVNGRTSIDWDKKLALDVEYVEKRSFWFDIKILLKTIGVVLFGENGNSLEEQSFIVYMNSKGEARVEEPHSKLKQNALSKTHP